jgi:Retrotransposon gag protein
MAEEGKNPMEEVMAKLSATELQMLMRAFSVAASESTPRPVQRIDLPLLDRKLDGPASYLSWSRQVRYTLEGKDLEGYLTGDKNEPAEGSPERAEWKSTHMTIYMWLLSSLTPSIASTVDGIDRVKDVWEKLNRTYDGVGNNLRVFHIEREIEAIVQGDRSIQEYATNLERLWAYYDHFSPAACCKDPECKRGARDTQRRTMHFMRGLNQAFEPRCVVLLA